MSQKKNLLNLRQQHIKKAKNIAENNGMMAITTFNTYKMYMSNEEASAKQKTRNRLQINNAELEKRIKKAQTILNNESKKISYMHMKNELNNHMKTIKNINNQLSSLLT